MVVFLFVNFLVKVFIVLDIVCPVRVRRHTEQLAVLG